MAYSRKQPLMVIVEDGLKSEGLLEHGSEWYVQSVKLDVAALSTAEFNGVLSSWKKKISEAATTPKPLQVPSEFTVAQLVGGLKPAQLGSVLSAVAALVVSAFVLGGKLLGG